MEYTDNNPLIGPAPKQPGGEATPVIMQKITLRPPFRHKVEIPDWRLAMRSAEAYIPRYVYLYDLYTEMWLDAHLMSVSNKRIMGVTNKKWQYVDGNDELVDSVNQLISKKSFGDTLVAIVKAILEGYRMIEYSYKEGKLSAYVVPPKHMRPRTGIVTYEQQGDEGINIREGIYAQTVMEVGDPYDLGIFLSAAQYVIFKRGGFSDWANFVEVFGQPLVDAEWDGYDEKQRILLEQALEAMGNGGKITRPAGTKINLLENKANATGDLQRHFIESLNAEISKVILGQTETTESSSSSGYAQSKTHADVEDDINQSDINYVKQILNGRFIEILEALGVPGVKGGRFIIAGEDEETISKKDKLEMDVALAVDLKLPISDDYFYENYNIPKPDNYDALKKAQQDAANAQMIDVNSNPLKPDPANTPPSSAKKTDKNPGDKGKAGNKKPGKMAKLFLQYRHFFG